MLSLLAENAAEGKRLTDNRARLMDDLAMRLFEHELQEGKQPPALTDDKLATSITSCRYSATWPLICK